MAWAARFGLGVARRLAISDGVGAVGRSLILADLFDLVVRSFKHYGDPG